MKNFIRFVYVFLSVAIVITFAFSCVKLTKDTSDEPPVNTSEQSSDTSESSVEISIPDSSDVSSAEETTSDDSSDDDNTSDDSTSDDSTSDDSSSDDTDAPDSSNPDESSRPVSGDTDPITPAPGKFETSVYDSYFDGSIFVGHSVMVHFSNAVSSWQDDFDDKSILGDALFCCTSSFSCYNNLNETPDDDDNTLPRYRGEAYNIEDLPAAIGRNRIFLGLMGLNDLAMVGTPSTCAEKVTEEVIRCIELIKEKTPDAEVVILSATYLTRDQSYPKLNNRNMSLLNQYVLEYCNENGIDFIDVGSMLCDGDGYLASYYSRDAYCHLTKEAYIHWMTVLRDYAQKKMTNSWSNPTSVAIFGE